MPEEEEKEVACIGSEKAEEAEKRKKESRKPPKMQK